MLSNLPPSISQANDEAWANASIANKNIFTDKTRCFSLKDIAQLRNKQQHSIANIPRDFGWALLLQVPGPCRVQQQGLRVMALSVLQLSICIPILFAPPKKPWKDDSTGNTKKQWFPMVSKLGHLHPFP